MSKISGLSLNRRFEKGAHGEIIRREKKINIPMQEMEIDCIVRKFVIKVGPNQIINTRKVCLKLLAKEKELQNVKNKNKFQSKGFQGQRSY